MARQDCAGQRRSDREQRGNAVDTDHFAPRQRRRRQEQQAFDAPARQQKSSSRAEHTDENAFRGELRRDLSARCANRHSHRDLAAACGRAGQEQIREIRAGDQEHEAHCSTQRCQSGLHVADDFLIERGDRQAQRSAIAGRILRHQPHREHCHRRTSGLEGHSVLEPRDDDAPAERIAVVIGKGPRVPEVDARRDDAGAQV